MKKYFLILAVLFTVTAHSACAQRSTTSDYNYLKAVEAYYDEDDDDKALKLVTDQIDDTPDHIDSRFLRAKIYWRADKYDAALRDVRHAIKRYNGKPSVFKSTLYGLMVMMKLLKHIVRLQNLQKKIIRLVYKVSNLIAPRHYISPKDLMTQRKCIWKCYMMTQVTALR